MSGAPAGQRQRVQRERRPFLIAASVVAVAAALTGSPWLFGATAVVSFWVFWFFRDPQRDIPPGEQVAVSPADGRIVQIGEVKEGHFLNEPRLRVSIFLNIFNVHVNRAPCAGTVREVRYQPGRFLAAQRPDASELNEQNAVLLETPRGERVVFVQIAGLIARRIVSWIKTGDRLEKGERFGMIRFGSRTDLFLPLGTEIQVRVGDSVKGGETIIGLLPGGHP